MPSVPRILATCEDCGQEFQAPYGFGFRSGYYCGHCRDIRDEQWRAEQCRTRELRLAQHRQEWIEDPRRGIPRHYRAHSWGDFRFDRGGEGNMPLVKSLRKYAQEFPVDGPPIGASSLLLTSETNGVGKTMLACLVLKEIIGRFEGMRRDRCPFQLWSMADLRLRAKTAERYSSQENPEDVIRDYTAMWLLVIDDVGKELLTGPESAVAYETYYTILDARYKADLPVILTSNLNTEPWRPGGPSLVDLMGRASLSRLAEMTGREVYVIEGEDRR